MSDYHDSVIYCGDIEGYSVRWDGHNQVHAQGRAATLWGPDSDGRVCRMSAHLTLHDAVSRFNQLVGQSGLSNSDIPAIIRRHVPTIR